MMHLLPGDPIRVMYGDKMPEDMIERIRHEMGLDRPMYVQYVDYMSKFFKGDFGVSLKYKVPVIKKVVKVLPRTLELTFGALFLSVSMGLPLGLISALKRGTMTDNIIRIVSLYIYSNPGFWVALLLQIVFGLTLQWFPISGYTPTHFNAPTVTGMITIDSLIAMDFQSFIASLRHLFLPLLTIGITSIPRMSRISRAALLDVLGEDYIRTAITKGVSKGAVIYKHALRNALLPVITILGGTFASMVGGSVIIEQIFSIPGMGRLLMESLYGRDFPMIQGVVGVYAIMVILINTFVDIIYAVADPRVKF